IKQVDSAEVARDFCCFTDEQTRRLAIIYKRARIQTRHLAVLEGSSAAPSFFPPTTNASDRVPTTAQRVQRDDAEARPLARDVASLALALCSGQAPPPCVALGFVLGLVVEAAPFL